jgi:transcriptional regulator with XRE-family HTH domain
VTDTSLAALLRRHRHAAQLTLEQLSELSGVSVRALSNMERAESMGPQQKTIEAVADALGLRGIERALVLTAAQAGRRRVGEASPTALAMPRGVSDFTGRATDLAALKRFCGDIAGRGTRRRHLRATGSRQDLLRRLCRHRLGRRLSGRPVLRRSSRARRPAGRSRGSARSGDSSHLGKLWSVAARNRRAISAVAHCACRAAGNPAARQRGRRSTSAAVPSRGRPEPGADHQPANAQRLGGNPPNAASSAVGRRRADDARPASR